ncbi:MAG: MBL fold metallo-hydrolase [Clostridia bacterium]|nr:MBL fold metallo-hydrolase [Clostridia bacterium]
MNKITENIFRQTCVYKDIFTTVYLIKTDKGAMLFDAASYDSDVEEYIFPLLDEAGVEKSELKYVFISHAHADHAGALAHLVELLPNITILSRSENIAAQYENCKLICPQDGDVFLDVCKVVAIPGHTADSAAILDLCSNLMITGDSLQLYGIFGSGNWMANIGLVPEHLKAIERLRALDVEAVCTAHDYHPYGWKYTGKEAISKALDACIEPLKMIAELIRQHSGCDDETIREIFNSSQKLPTVGCGVIASVRKTMEDGML